MFNQADRKNVRDYRAPRLVVYGGMLRLTAAGTGDVKEFTGQCPPGWQSVPQLWACRTTQRP